MKWVQMVETFDGKRHRDVLKAEQHLDELYGAELTKLCHDLSKLDGKYTNFVGFFDVASNQDRVVRMSMLKKDILIEKDD